MPVGEEYRRFGVEEARGESAVYADWSEGVAGDAALTALIEALPPAKQQPNLIFAAARFLGAPVGPFGAFRDWTLAHWARVGAEALRRRTQTNEVGRCAVLLPILAALPPPLALLEVGASAGLCLFPDRYSYRYSGRAQLDPVDGASSAVLTCATSGPVPVPAQVPRVVWRAGIDLNPLDVRSPEDTRWLQTLVWPEQRDRRERLDAAIAIARADPPRLVAGDLNARLVDLAAQAPAEATLVVFHTAVLAYLDRAGRETFVDAVRRLPAHWVSGEGAGVLPFVDPEPPPSPDATKAHYLLSLDGRPMAYARPHGQSLTWLA